MNALRILGFLGLAAALIAALIYRLLAFQHREPGSSFIRAMLEGVGFTDVGARYLRRQYIAMAVALALVLLLLAIWPRP
jgi:hypothetical protein